MKRSLLITLVALAVAVPAALASGGDGTRNRAQARQGLPGGQGLGQIQGEARRARAAGRGRAHSPARRPARRGRRRRREGRHGEGERPRRGAAQPQQRAGPACPSGLRRNGGEGAHRWRNDGRQRVVLAESRGGRPGSARSAATPSDRSRITKPLHLGLVLEREKTHLAIGMAQG